MINSQTAIAKEAIVDSHWTFMDSVSEKRGQG